jgi:hypothetical protein
MVGTSRWVSRSPRYLPHRLLYECGTSYPYLLTLHPTANQLQLQPTTQRHLRTHSATFHGHPTIRSVLAGAWTLGGNPFCGLVMCVGGIGIGIGIGIGRPACSCSGAIVPLSLPHASSTFQPSRAKTNADPDPDEAISRRAYNTRY